MDYNDFTAHISPQVLAKNRTLMFDAFPLLPIPEFPVLLAKNRN